MLALTLHEPWATLIAMGHKTIETRSWLSTFRGDIAIHAGKTDRHLVEWRSLWLEANDGVPGLAPKTPDPWPLGCIVAVVRLVACEPTESVKPDAKNRAFGNFSAGRYAWTLGELRPLKSPVPARGYQLLWDVPEDVEALVSKQLVGGRP